MGELIVKENQSNWNPVIIKNARVELIDMMYFYNNLQIIMMRCNSSFANYYITNLLQWGVMIVLHYVRYGRRKSGFPNGALESTNQKMQRDILAGLH